jgi:hypothetical protein
MDRESLAMILAMNVERVFLEEGRLNAGVRKSSLLSHVSLI